MSKPLAEPADQSAKIAELTTLSQQQAVTLTKLAAQAEASLRTAADQLREAKVEAEATRADLTSMRAKFVAMENEREILLFKTAEAIKTADTLKAKDKYYAQLEDGLFVMKCLAEQVSVAKK